LIAGWKSGNDRRQGGEMSFHPVVMQWLVPVTTCTADTQEMTVGMATILKSQHPAGGALVHAHQGARWLRQQGCKQKDVATDLPPNIQQERKHTPHRQSSGTVVCESMHGGDPIQV